MTTRDTTETTIIPHPRPSGTLWLRLFYSGANRIYNQVDGLWNVST